MKKFSLKKFFALFFLCLIPLAMLALLYFNLETYYDEGARITNAGRFSASTPPSRSSSAPSSRCATAAAEKPFS